LGWADQGKLAEGVARSEDRDDDELAAAQHHPHADMTGGNQVEGVGRVALMKDHLVTAVGPPPQPGDQPVPLMRRQRRKNRPVHGSNYAAKSSGCRPYSLTDLNTS
jgi:hypothetical protein